MKIQFECRNNIVIQNDTGPFENDELGVEITIQLHKQIKHLEIKIPRNELYCNLNPASSHPKLRSDVSINQTIYKFVWGMRNHPANSVGENTARKIIISSVKLCFCAQIMT